MMIAKPHLGLKAAAAYSLVELIVVSGVVMLLTSLAVPSALDLLKAMRLNHAAAMIEERLTEARWLATSHNRDIEVRLYRTGNGLSQGEASGHGMQLFKLNDLASPGLKPETNAVQMVPEGMEDQVPFSVQFSINDEFTSLWKLPLQTEHSPKGPREYVAFRYRPDGSTDLAEDQKWTLSLVSQPEDDASRLSSNFVVFMIDPVTGHISSFRPD